MKKLLTLALVALFVPGSLLAQTNKKSAKAEKQEAAKPAFVPSVEGPEIQFERTVHDYGTMEQGGNGDTEFKFKNVGSEPLILSNVQSSCGCTTPSWPREPIMPGQEAAIKVHYDTNRIGGISKTVTVTTNGKTDRVTLRITGNINPKAN